MKHRTVQVYRTLALGDCTNNGITAKNHTLTLFWECERNEAIAYCENPDNHIDAEKSLLLVERDLWGEDHMYAEPLLKPEGRLGMMGGNFVLGDSCMPLYRGRSTTMPIPVHDRFETYEEYEALSR